MAKKKNKEPYIPKGPQRPLTEEESKLWNQVAQSTKPLARDQAPTPLPPKPAKLSYDNPPRYMQVEPQLTEADFYTPPSDSRQASLSPGNLDSVDGSTAEKLRKGKLPLEGKLDLHGYTQEKAFPALQRFIARCYAEGKRCVIVVTGKGKKSDRIWQGEPGILKSALPGWLNQEPNRSKVVAYHRAQPQHGGEGAYYVLIKRNRGL